MHSKNLNELAAGLEAGAFSSVELTRVYLARIESLSKTLNCLITVTPETALAEAEAADQRRQKGQAGPLTGIPVIHKDIFCTKGIKTSCASRMLDNFIAPYDATVVHRMKTAGMVTLGKANMDEFAMGSSNENSFFGPVKNPWDTSRVPGGSSGGSAAAVAARLAPVATGTDTGGSIRQPAALCGITGLKPTYGRVSRYGMVAYASSLDQAGPMTYGAADAARVLQVIAGFDERDSTSASEPVPDYTVGLEEALTGLKIGIPEEYFGEGVEPGVASAIENALQTYQQLGAELVPIRLPTTQHAVPTYYVVAPAECSSNLSRYDGVRFGHRCEAPVDLEDLYKRSRGEGFGAEVKRRIMVGTYALSAGYYDAYYIKAQRVRRRISDDFQQAFQQVDVIMSPTSPTTAFALGEKANDPINMYLSDIFTLAVNLAGLPGISIPAGFSEGRPVGLQIIANYFQEARLLNIAHRYQGVSDWHQQCPQGYA